MCRGERQVEVIKCRIPIALTHAEVGFSRRVFEVSVAPATNVSNGMELFVNWGDDSAERIHCIPIGFGSCFWVPLLPWQPYLICSGNFLFCGLP
jgi:hypothetical protein